jgi:uncharacterized protein
LGSLFGSGAREPERPRPGMGSPFGRPQGVGGMGMPGGMGGQPGPWGGGQPGAFGAPQRGGSGFLGTAMATAAGVAGGMMLGSALSSAFGGSGAEAAKGLFGGGQDAQANAGGQDHGDLSPFQDPGSGGYQDASFDPSADYGGDFGGDGGGDWA